MAPEEMLCFTYEERTPTFLYLPRTTRSPLPLPLLQSLEEGVTEISEESINTNDTKDESDLPTHIAQSDQPPLLPSAEKPFSASTEASSDVCGTDDHQNSSK